ncbi:hypothetical protein [Labilibaculum sp.]|uniref:hypothetical protein n=1 Tax=Labilibaculum sp. TaxID=2060723 RepID=UPI002AA64453|nr:hypothetical protein [Labilibaculum sp.]
MNREERFKLKRQIAQYNKKRDELDAWLRPKRVNHPDFENKIRERNNLIFKISNLEAHMQPTKRTAMGICRIPSPETNRFKTF